MEATRQTRDGRRLAMMTAPWRAILATSSCGTSTGAMQDSCSFHQSSSVGSVSFRGDLSNVLTRSSLLEHRCPAC